MLHGKRVERVAGSGDLPNFYRKPYGPGISDAFRDAELLADALHAGFSGHQPLESALARYERQRNAARMQPYAPVQAALLWAVAHNPAAASRFFGVLTGVVKPADFFTPRTMIRLLGVRGMVKALSQQIFPVGEDVTTRGGTAAALPS